MRTVDTRDWASAGMLVPAITLSEDWGLTPHELAAAEARGDLFSIAVNEVPHYPCEFLDLSPSTVATVCQALGGLTPAEKVVFWKRKHGSLRGGTVSNALLDHLQPDALERVVALAQSWAAEVAP